MGNSLSSVNVRWIEGLNYFDKQVRAGSEVSGVSGVFDIPTNVMLFTTITCSQEVTTELPLYHDHQRWPPGKIGKLLVETRIDFLEFEVRIEGRSHKRTRT